MYDQLHAMKEFQDTPAITLRVRLPKREIAKRSLIGLYKPLELRELLETIEELLES